MSNDDLRARLARVKDENIEVYEGPTERISELVDTCDICAREYRGDVCNVYETDSGSIIVCPDCDGVQ